MSRPGPEPASYRLVSGLFLRLLAVVYLIAFVSIGIQIDGLAGPRGILPYGVYLGNAWTADGWAALWMNPSLFWLSADTWALEGAAVLGILFSVLLFIDVRPRTSAASLFVLYLSFVGAFVHASGLSSRASTSTGILSVEPGKYHD